MLSFAATKRGFPILAVASAALSIAIAAGISPAKDSPAKDNPPAKADPQAKADMAASSTFSGASKAEIERAIANLASADFDVRERASHALWLAGAEAEPYLEKAVREADDFEVVARARQILGSFHMGIYPDTPAEVVQLVGQIRMGNLFQKQTAAQRLKTMGKTELLSRLIAKETNALVRDQLNQVLTGMGPARGSASISSIRPARKPEAAALSVRLRLARGDFDGVERQLAAAGSDDLMRDYAAFLLARGKLDAEIKKVRAEIKPADTLAQRRLTWMLRASGDLPGAMAAARLVKDDTLIQDLEIEMADWKELAKAEAKTDVAELASSEDPQAALRLARIIAFRHLAGEKAACDQAAAAAVKSFKQNQMEKYLVKALLLNDRTDDVIEAAKSLKRVEAAFGLLVAEGRFKEALQLVKIDVPVPVKIDWALWLKDGNATVPMARRFLAREVMKALCATGEGEQAGRLIEAVVADAKAKLQGDDWEVIAFDFVDWRSTADHPEIGDALAAKLLDMNPKKPEALIELLYAGQDASAALLWKALRKQFPGENQPAALKHLRRIMNDKPDAAAVADFARVIPIVEEQSDWAGPVTGPVSPDTYEATARKLLALATLAHRYGQDKLTAKYLARITAATIAAPTLIDVGNLHAEMKRWDDACKAYEAAWNKDRTSAAALYRLGWAQSKRGDEVEGSKQMELALVLPLADGRSRYELVRTLEKLHKDDEAARQRQWLVRVAAMHDGSIVQSLMATAAEAAKKGDAKAAALNERIAVEMLVGNRVLAETRFYLEPSLAAHSARARELLRAGKTKDAVAELHRAEAIQPADLQLALDCDADLRKHGAADEADALYRRLLERHEAFCRDFPKSSVYHNDLAWLAANLDRDLDEALAHAQRAVELEPQSAGILDTLAEVRFRRGDRDEAVRLAKRCLEMEPGGEHFQKQLARFEAQPAAVPR